MAKILDRHLHRLETFLQRDGDAPLWSEIRLVKDTDISHGTKMEIHRSAIYSAAEFSEHFQELVDSGYGWINLVANGLYDGSLLVSVELPKNGPSGLSPDELSVNLSGPYLDPEGNKIWDLSHRIVVM